MPFQAAPLRPPVWLRGGHLDTIYAKALQPSVPTYRRELLPDSTGQTQVAYDFIDGGNPNAPLVVLFHGLEGSSHSHYARTLMHAVSARGWHGVVAHFRSCGEVENTAPVFYHSGDSREIDFMLCTLSQRYHKIYAAGVSLGGNALAKYMAEQGEAALAHAAAVVSAPVDLVAASTRFESGSTRLLYTRYFLDSLLPKACAVSPDNPSLLQCKTLADFDNAFTAPVHGFQNALDYYQQSSAKPLLPQVRKPLLLLNALNDPFLPSEVLPTECDVSPSVTLLQPARGGHVGFVSGGGRGHIQWLPQVVLNYFAQFE